MLFSLTFLSLWSKAFSKVVKPHKQQTYLRSNKAISHSKMTTPLSGHCGRLRCSFQPNASKEGSQQTTSALWFRPNQGKRSSFLLDLNTDDDAVSGSSYHVIPEQPCHLFIECVMNTDVERGESNHEDFFFLGGFQLISTARSVEVFVTRKGSEKEELLMACRGIPVRDKAASLSDCFKVFSVVPGGPRPVTQLHLHLHAGPDSSSIEVSSTSTKLVSIQLTGRIPDAAQLQQQQTPQSQITPSSAMMMQQMMASTPTSVFSASTPLASGSGQRKNPFFSQQSQTSDRVPPSPAAMHQRPPPTPVGLQMQTPSSAQGTPNQSSFTPTTALPSANTEAIIAGVSFLVRSEGQANVQLLQNELQKHQAQIQQHMNSMDQRQQEQQSTLQSLIQQQQVMMQAQRDTMLMLQQQQQQLQWLVMSQHQQTQKQQEQEETPDVIACEELQHAKIPCSPLETPSSFSTFPTVSSYDPTCRVSLSDLKDVARLSSPQANQAEVLQKDDTQTNEPTQTSEPQTDATKALEEGKKFTSLPEHQHSSEMAAVCRKRAPEPVPKLGLIEEGKHVNISERENFSVQSTNTDLETTECGSADELEDDNKDSKEAEEKDGKVDSTDVKTADDKYGDDNDDENGNEHDDNDSPEDQEGRNDEGEDSCGGRSDPSREDDHDKKSRLSGGETDAETGFTESYCEDDEYDEDCDGDGSNSIVRKQFMFVASKKGVFPENKGVAHNPERDSASESSSVNNNYSGGKRAKATKGYELVIKDNGDQYDNNECPPSVKQDPSMIDHCSIRLENNATALTELTSLPSAGTMTVPEIEQVESIEVLAVFPDSPSAVESNPSINSSSINSDQTSGDSSIHPSRGLSAGATDYTENGSSYDDEDSDLVSVSLKENENSYPAVSMKEELHRRSVAKGTHQPGSKGRGVNSEPANRESVFFP
jgi:hypothetical protein